MISINLVYVFVYIFIMAAILLPLAATPSAVLFIEDFGLRHELSSAIHRQRW
jgi:hypothetical protein